MKSRRPGCFAFDYLFNYKEYLMNLFIHTEWNSVFFFVWFAVGCETRIELIFIRTEYINTWYFIILAIYPLRRRHNERDAVSYQQPHDCLLNRLFRHWWTTTSRLRITGLCEGNSPFDDVCCRRHNACSEYICYSKSYWVAQIEKVKIVSTWNWSAKYYIKCLPCELNVVSG